PVLLVKWADFIEYCGVDAELGLAISKRYLPHIPAMEHDFALITQQMNDVGWFVDLPLVQEMQRRYKENLATLTQQFQQVHDPQGQLNIQSYKQLQKWCAERGVRAKSFDQQAVPKLIRSIERKLA